MDKYKVINDIEELLNTFKIINTDKCISVSVDNEMEFILVNSAEASNIVLSNVFIKQHYEEVSKVLNSVRVIIFNNAKEELKLLMRFNINIYTNIFDIYLAKRILGKPILNLVGNYKQDSKSIEKKIKDKVVEIMRYEEYRETLIKEIQKRNLENIAKIEFSCAKGLAEMELTGIRVDVNKWQELMKKYKEEIEDKAYEISEFFNDNGIQLNLFGDSSELKKYIHSNKLILEKLKTYGIETNTTSKKVLMKYKDNDFVRELLEYRKLDKLYTSSLLNIGSKIIDEKIHPEYNQIGAGSGRMSCSNPNIQQIPRNREIRECFLPNNPQNVLVIADYSQIELRVVAEVSKDSKMIEAYKKGRDLHLNTASLLLNKELTKITKDERQAAKAINFGLVYAMGAEALKRYCENVFNIYISIETAQRLRNRFLQVYSGVRKWQDRIKKDNPYTDKSLAGRIYKYNDKDGLATKCNIPIQGTAADIIKDAIGNVYEKLRYTNAKLIAVIHDEIIIESTKEESEMVKEILKKTMENSAKEFMIHVPLLAEASIRRSWAT